MAPDGNAEGDRSDDSRSAGSAARDRRPGGFRWADVGRRMAFGSAGSLPSATPGSPWVSRLIHRICAGNSGSGESEEGTDEHDGDLGRAAGEAVEQESANIGIDPSPFLRRGHYGGEVVVGEHQIGGLTGDFGAAPAHGDADIGAAQGRSVVHAVPGHRDNVAARPASFDDVELLLGRGAGEDGFVTRSVPAERQSTTSRLGDDAEFGRDGARGAGWSPVMRTGLIPAVRQATIGRGGSGARRIDDRDQAE